MSADVTGGAVPWHTPLLVRVGYGSTEKVGSPKDALHYLHNRWPYSRGSLYSRAESLCKAAAEGRVSSEAAKDAFIAAALEARMLAYTHH